MKQVSSGSSLSSKMSPVSSSTNLVGLGVVQKKADKLHRFSICVSDNIENLYDSFPLFHDMVHAVMTNHVAIGCDNIQSFTLRLINIILVILYISVNDVSVGDFERSMNLHDLSDSTPDPHDGRIVHSDLW